MSEEERAGVLDARDGDDKLAAQGAVLTGTLLHLPGWNLYRPPRIVGESLDLYLAHPERGQFTLTFSSLRDFTTPRTLAERLAVTCGRRGKPPKLEDIITALALISELAAHEQTESDDEIARSWGESFLERIEEASLDWSDQEQRWEALRDVRDAEDEIKKALRQSHYAARHGVVEDHAVVLRDCETGVRYVQAGWLLSHIKHQGDTVSRGGVSQAMRRVGWDRPQSLKVWAREPGPSDRKLSMHAYVVPVGWSSN